MKSVFKNCYWFFGLIFTITLFSSYDAHSQKDNIRLGFHTLILKRNDTGDILKSGNYHSLEIKSNYGWGLGSDLYYIFNKRITGRLSTEIRFEKDEILFLGDLESPTKINEHAFVTLGAHTIIGL